MALSSRARRDLAVAAATVLLCVLLFPGAFLRGELFFERDLHLDWYPRLEALARCMQEGAWPLWDRSIGFGQPLLAGRLGAFVAAALFVLSGPVQSSLNLWHHFAGLAWMPWVLLAVDRCARRPARGAALGLAALAAVQVLAGSADVCAMTWGLAAVWSAFRLIERRRGRRWRVVAALVVAAGLGAGLSATVWWPAADVAARSPRQELPEDIRTAWSVPPAGPSFDPAHEVLLAEGRARRAPDGFVGTSRVLLLANDRVTLEVAASAPGFVVLADAFDPGWRATVGGRGAPVHRANVAFRAVAVPEGRHVVEMVYRPRAVSRGVTLSAAFLLLSLAALAAAARRGRRARGR